MVTQEISYHKRKLDFFLAVYNRPKVLHHILKTGLNMGIPNVYFIVYDDASDLSENVNDIGLATVEDVCKSFNSTFIIYIRNPTNIGFARSLERYYKELSHEADYSALLNPKDEFINSSPIISAIKKLDEDPLISLVIYPLQQHDRNENNKPIHFSYDRMSGRDFVAAHIRDEKLQHCSSYAITRISAAKKVGIPNNLDLRALGLEDGSGIDHDLLFRVATTGDVEFEDIPPLRRSIVDGYTERFPLTFAYTQYQYARRLMQELKATKFVTSQSRRIYLSFWHLIISRGIVVAYRPVHGNEQEQGVKRIRPHLTSPILIYLILECIRFRILPRKETVRTYIAGAKLLLRDWLRKKAGESHIC